MDYSQILEKAAVYTQKFVDAAIPVAQKAYEIGLMTMQIDALSTIVPMLFLLGFATYLFCKAGRCWKEQKKLMEAGKAKTKDYYGEPITPFGSMSEGNQIIFMCSSLFGLTLSVISLVNLLDAWLWVKLFKPELWLAKQAIDAVLAAAK